MGVPLDGAVVTELRMLAGERRPLSVKELIVRYHNSLLSHLRQRLRVADDAADVAQEAYIRMLQYEGSHEVQSPSSLLFHLIHVSGTAQWHGADYVCESTAT